MLMMESMSFQIAQTTSGRRQCKRCNTSSKLSPLLTKSRLTLPALIFATTLLLLTLHTTVSRSEETATAAAAAAAPETSDDADDSHLKEADSRSGDTEEEGSERSSLDDTSDYDYSENSSNATSSTTPAPIKGGRSGDLEEESGGSRSSSSSSSEDDQDETPKSRKSHSDLPADKEEKPKELQADSNSGVEKGSATELPPVSKLDPDDGSRGKTGPPNRLGLVSHKDDSKSSAAKKTNGGDDQEEDEDEDGQSRAFIESVESVLGPGSRAAPLANSTTTTTSTTVPPEIQIYRNSSTATANATGLASSSKEQLRNATRIEKFNQYQLKKQETKLQIIALGAKSEHLSEKRNSSIMINGRKFDQVEPVECVDQEFYDILVKDLGLIMPDRSRDYYGTYFDPDYAKAIGALIETPVAKSEKGIEASEGKLAIKDVIAEVRSMWNVTMSTYTSRRDQLDMTNLPLGRSGLPKSGSRASTDLDDDASTTTTTLKPSIRISANFDAQPRHQAALANYRYLQDRLEQLKLLLLSGEEALIIMNNKVRKLNQAVGETELGKALCSCITSRSGRAAFGLMNELFVDENSAKLMRTPEEGKRRGDEAAVDVAEFCAYWYGDTIRSEALQKEKQIKRLVLAVAKERERDKLSGANGNKINATKLIKQTKTIHRADGSVLKETRTRVVTSLIEMTDLWMPRMANWIRTTLKLGKSDPEKTLAKLSKGNFSLIDTTSSRTSYTVSATTSAPTAAADDNSAATTTTGAPDSSRRRRRRRRETDDNGFSTPFDNPGTYADIDDPVQLASSAMMQQRALEEYPILTGESRRKRAASSTTKKPRIKPTASARTKRPQKPQKPKKPKKPVIDNKKLKSANSTDDAQLQKTITKLEAKGNLVPTASDPSAKPEVAKKVITTTARPVTTSTRAPKPTREPGFETRISDASSKCASDGFTALLDIAYDQNSLMYETNDIKRDDPYIKAFSDSFREVFEKRWREKRDSWSKSLDQDENGKKVLMSRSVDEEISDSFEAHGGAYERGARLGFTVGKFIGDKSANQWPDPAELNTFSYDSLFLAGVGHDYSEEDSKALERRIVTEAAKRVAFSESNRIAFAKTIHSAYLNGAFIVPTWGVLHAQRAVAKKAAKEGGKAGFDAASKAASDFMPKASKFFQMHRQQRLLAAPYKKTKRLNDKFAGLSEEINEVQFQTELNRNITATAIDCGQKSGTLMGAVMGLVVAPEAFETYTRFRGSLEALESEFYQYKLGAMRAYELGETWALLNYTATMNKNLQKMKTRMGSHPTDPPGDAKRRITTQAPTSTSIKANLTSTFAKKAEKEESSSLFESKTGHPGENGKADEVSGQKNTNNIFQFMIINYGTHLVANHSRKHMLKIRNMFIDENLLRDMKVQSGDLIANPELAMSGLSSLNSSTSETSIDDSDPFEPGPYAGELRGEFNSLKDEQRKRPIKFDILDLGPVLEFADEMKKPVAGSNKTSTLGSANQTLLEDTPLTDDLSKVGKLFMKMSVARRKKTRPLNGPDEVAAYLNGGNKFDQGDGYMAGTFSAVVTHLANDTREEANEPLVHDDFSLETQILDELHERIEKTPAEMGSVGMVEHIMRAVTTMAPKKVEAITEKPSVVNASATTMQPFSTTTMSPLLGIAQNATKTTTTTRKPKSGQRSAMATLDNDNLDETDED